MSDYLKEKYFQFVEELDPFRDSSEDPEELPDMLYNLENIRKQLTRDDNMDLYDFLEETIEEFYAAGVEI